jgi:hypothetical protein
VIVREIVNTVNHCIFSVFSHVEIQTGNQFFSPKFWLRRFFKERNFIKKRLFFWSSMREIRIMFVRICQISLTLGKFDGHCPLKFGDTRLVEPKFLAPVGLYNTISIKMGKFQVPNFTKWLK